jgi:hypothetical protein
MVGAQVTVEGDVVAARTVSDSCVLEFSADDPTAFRVVLLIPAITSLPRQPERLYLGKRVRASGLIRAFQGRPEMVLRSPGQIEVVDVAGPARTAETLPAGVPAPTPPRAVAPPPPATIAPKPPVAVTPPAPIAVAPPPAAQAAVAAAPTPPPSPESPAEPPARSLGEAIVRQLPAADCDRARASWKDAAQSADDLAGALTRCLRAGSYRCRDASAALAPALTALEWAEQQVDDGCP